MRYKNLELPFALNWPFVLKYFLLLATFSLSITWFLALTTVSLGITPDSVVYIGTANNLLLGKGLTVPFSLYYSHPVDSALVHYPPLYPLVLFSLGWLGFDIIQAARWLHVLILAGNLLLVWLIIRSTTKSLVAILAGWIGSTIILMGASIMVFSEPLFFLFSLLSLYLFSKFLKHSSEITLIFGVITALLATATRYAGAALIPVWLLGLWFFAPVNLKKKIVCAFKILGFSIFAIMVSKFFGVSSSDRLISFHFIPNSLFLLVFILVCIFPLRLHLSATERGLILFSIFYSLVILITVNFLDAHTPLDQRILSPLALAGWIFLIIQFDKIKTPAFGIFFLAILIFTGYPYINGLGYAAPEWRKSSIIGLIKSLPEDQNIYSNGPDAIYFLTGRSTIGIPALFDPNSLLKNKNYLSEVDSLDRQFMAGALVINFQSFLARNYFPKVVDIAKNNNWFSFFQNPGGTVYKIP